MESQPNWSSSERQRDLVVAVVVAVEDAVVETVVVTVLVPVDVAVVSLQPLLSTASGSVRNLCMCTVNFSASEWHDSFEAAYSMPPKPASHLGTVGCRVKSAIACVAVVHSDSSTCK